MSRKPRKQGKRPRWSRRWATPIIALGSFGLLATAGVQAELVNRLPGPASEPAAASHDWYDDTAAEQLRQDQCLMTDVLRLGGPAMFATAQDGLNQTPEKLHELADRQYWEETPLAAAYGKDREAYKKELDALHNRLRDWGKPLDGLSQPGGFDSLADWQDPPGSIGSEQDDFYTQTGLTTWIAERFWKDDGDFYEDPSPRADGATVGKVKEVGTPLYGRDPDPGLPSDEWNRALEERAAFRYLADDSLHPTGADDARIFLASGGFARTAPEPGTAEYRIAVEDLKTRFAACAWRDPIDPNTVYGGISRAAAEEWQREVSSQATQRNQILDANETATTALTKGAKSLGELLGQSWVADRLTRWQDYWAAGGLGWVGDVDTVVEVVAAKGMCLDVQGGGNAPAGTPVQIYTCNGGGAQKWKIEENGSSGWHLRNPGSNKCLDVNNNSSANGTKIQVWTCNQSSAQTWQANLRGVTALKHVGTGKCLDLHKFDKGYDSWLWGCNGTGPQQFRIVPQGHNGTDNLDYPDKAQFDKAKAGVTSAQTKAKSLVADLKAQLAAAQKSAAASDAAEKASYTVADSQGAPRGRGLLVGQQKNQVTQGAVAAVSAMVKAGETAEAATRASAADSETIAQRAVAQAAQVKADFRKQAAYYAELQAKAAADGAKLARDNAKQDAATAKAKLDDALKAEADAKAAAADARAKRLAAEAEEKTAKAEKETAAAKQAEADQHKQNAQAEAETAREAKETAETAEKNAGDKRDEAKKAADHAKAMRDDAWDAEQKADATRAKAAAKEAYADSLDAGEAADAARAEADKADKAADEAEAAAGRARSEANAATKAAEEADAAATRAEAAAKRARAHADAAQAAKLKADAAVRTATAAVADAIKASDHAAGEARTAVKLAGEAAHHAKSAKTNAEAAKKEAAVALAASAKAAGYAHVTAQAAVDASNAAQQVAQPANDAIQLGSPYVTTDSAAGLVVLTGQASKTIAEQQQAVADAHAKNAKAEADAAKNIADQASGDAKQAFVHAANAAAHAANARQYAKEALGYAAEAAGYAAQAAKSLARTIEYDRQATEDAAAADRAAGRAEGYAQDARASADQAALDADAAHKAAAEAEQSAKDARSAADRAEALADEAEQYAKDAEKYAKEAQEAAERAEQAENAEQITTGTVVDEAGVSIGNMFFVVDSAKPIETKTLKKTEGCDGWFDQLFYDGDCTVTAEIRFKADISVYMCSADDLDLERFQCPSSATTYIDEFTSKELTQETTKNITIEEFNKDIDPVDILVGHWIRCVQKLTPGGASGSWGGCGWAIVDVATLFAGKILRPVADAVLAVDAAARTGIGFADAYRALRSLGVSEAAAFRIGVRGLDGIVKTCTRTARTALAPTSARNAAECPTGLIPYNSDEMSHLAFRYRTENGYYGADHNVAVAKVPGWNDPKTGDFVVANSGFQGHSETAILQKLKAKGFDAKQITALYTERQPCSNCASELASALKPGTPVTYSVPYNLEIWKEAKALLAEYVKRAGGGRTARSATSEQQAQEQGTHD
ncbi:RICIN domain-containing protein [Streptomyces sp. NPDC052023]|uniref:RICIN domain-containing protein n=1 Tax=Streptomyces sp. NPDC052023 TaxID=3365681 RepID=UPI0037D13A84